MLWSSFSGVSLVQIHEVIYSILMSQKSSIIVNCLDVMSWESTLAVIYGYFRINEFLGYNVKMDEFIKIIVPYLSQKIKLVKTNIDKQVKLFTEIPYKIHTINSQFVIGIAPNNKMLSIYHAIFLWITSIITLIMYLLE